MIGPKCLYLQEDFLKENILMQVRILLDKRNLKFNAVQDDFRFAS